MSNKADVPNKTEDLNLSVFYVTTGINKSTKTSTKDISCECKCKFDGRKCNSDQWWNNDKNGCKSKKRHVYEKDYIWNPATCSCKNRKYLASIMNDSAITSDKIIDSYDEETKTIPTNFNENKAVCKPKDSIFYLYELLRHSS